MTDASVLRARVILLATHEQLASDEIARRLELPVGRVEAWLLRPLGRPLRACALCGEPFAPVSPTQRFCCAAHREQRERRARLPERVCELCGEPFVPLRSTQRFCSAAHRERRGRRRPLPERVCELCGESFVPLRSTQRFCCTAHRDEHASRRRAEQRSCSFCGERFTARTARDRFCSPAHEQAHTRRPRTVDGWREHVEGLEAQLARVRAELAAREARALDLAPEWRERAA